MKNFRLPLLILAFLALGTLTANAAQLATAKVLTVSGTVTKYAKGAGGSPLKSGDILKQGDSLSVTALSEATLVFSNGSHLTVEENTIVSIAQLAQETFSGNQSYEALQADPSKSQVLLELNYGSVNGHVKKLQKGSKFDIETPIGTAAIRGTQFTVSLNYNAERGEFVLVVKNKDGKVDIISRYAGNFEYRGGVGNKGYDSTISDAVAEAIPQTNTIIIRLHRGDPFFDDLLNLIINFIPTSEGPTEPTIPAPEITPEDGTVQVVSPETPGP